MGRVRLRGACSCAIDKQSVAKLSSEKDSNDLSLGVLSGIPDHTFHDFAGDRHI